MDNYIIGRRNNFDFSPEKDEESDNFGEIFEILHGFLNNFEIHPIVVDGFDQMGNARQRQLADKTGDLSVCVRIIIGPLCLH
jgi:hypothetical protein